MYLPEVKFMGYGGGLLAELDCGWERQRRFVRCARGPRLMTFLALCCTVLIVTSFVNFPWLAQIFPSSGVQ